MIIHKLTAVFGRLSGETLELKDGLNIIQAPNESGKSTWSHFIRAMLYGVSSSERARMGFLPDKQRFQPWDGRPMEGRMELNWHGEEITLRREPTGSGRPMGPCLAEYTGTGERVQELIGKSVGERIVGVTEPVFRRSAFITRPELAVDKDSELEKRITSLVTSGSEEESYTDADERLRRWQRKRRWRSGSGRIPEAEMELMDVRRRLTHIEDENSRLALLREERAKLEAQEKLLETELKKHKRDAYLQAVQARREYDAALLAARAEADELSEKAGSFSRDDIRRVRETDARLKAAAETESRLAGERDEAQAELDAAVSSAGKTRGKPSAAVILLYAAGVIMLLAYFLVFQHVLLAAAAVAVLAAACVVLASQRAKKRREHEESVKRAEQALGELTEKCGEAKNDLDALKSELSSALAGISAAEDEDASAAALRAEELLASLGEARARLQALGEAPPLPEPDEPDLEKIEGAPLLSRREAEDHLSRVRSGLRQASSELARGEGGYSHLGDPVLLATKEQSLSREIQRLGEEYDALDLAMSALKEANLRLQQVFSPLICRQAAQMMNKLTGGGYSNVYFDRNMRFSATRQGDFNPRELEYLSDGTRDQLYLAVRLAVCMQALDSEDPCPIILDDALSCFDDERTENALRLLLELAEQRQIILFTCHGREKKLAEKILSEK